MPCRWYGPAARARRPRPSEKITFRVISGLSPQGHLTRANPPEGRAPHARMGTPWLHPGMSPPGPRPLDYSSLVTPYPALAYGPAARARRPRPSEKTAFRVISRFSPLGHASWACLPRGGAGSARPQRRHRPHPGISPLGPRPQRPTPHALRKDKLKPAR